MYHKQRNVGNPPGGFADRAYLSRAATAAPRARAAVTDVQKFLNDFNTDETLGVNTKETFSDANEPPDAEYLKEAARKLSITMAQPDASTEISSTFEEMEEDIAEREKRDKESAEALLGQHQVHVDAKRDAPVDDEITRNRVSDWLKDVPAAVKPSSLKPGDIVFGLFGAVNVPHPRKPGRIRLREARRKAEQEKAERERAAAHQPSSPIRAPTPRPLPEVAPVLAVAGSVAPMWRRFFAGFGWLVLATLAGVGSIFRRQPKRRRETQEGETEEGRRQKLRRIE